MASARALGKAVWDIFGPRMSPDFIVERTDAEHAAYFSTFPCSGFQPAGRHAQRLVIAGAPSTFLSWAPHVPVLQARDVVRLLGQKRLVMEQGDLDVVSLERLPKIQQKMLDGRMGKPKGVALVQADRAGRSIAAFETATSEST